eukprot:4964312-Pyramimonas_sp.AAC.1
MARRGRSPSVGPASDSQRVLAVNFCFQWPGAHSFFVPDLPGRDFVSRGVPRFTDIDKAVTIVKVSDLWDRREKKMHWSIVFNQERTSYE